MARLTSPELVMKDKILTIDVGTGSTRAAIVRIDGAMIGLCAKSMSKPRRVQVGQNRPRLYGGRPPATVYARCFALS